MKLGLGHWLAMLAALIVFILIATSDRFQYAFDYEFNVLTKDCTYEVYVQNKTQCIKPEYRD